MRAREKYVFLKSLVALALISLCLIAAQWQYHRGVDRHARNSMIEANIAAPELSLTTAATDLTKNEWRIVRTSGTFDSKKTILIRNRYFEGQYGFEYLTLFVTAKGQKF